MTSNLKRAPENWTIYTNTTAVLTLLHKQNIYILSLLIAPKYLSRPMFLPLIRDKMFPALGFGALLPPDWKVSHIPGLLL